MWLAGQWNPTSRRLFASIAMQWSLRDSATTATIWITAGAAPCLMSYLESCIRAVGSFVTLRTGFCAYADRIDRFIDGMDRTYPDWRSNGWAMR
jgi:hypothetical protein